MKTCLIVIDVQESFRHRPYSTERDMRASGCVLWVRVPKWPAQSECSWRAHLEVRQYQPPVN